MAEPKIGHGRPLPGTGDPGTGFPGLSAELRAVAERAAAFVGDALSFDAVAAGVARLDADETVDSAAGLVTWHITQGHRNDLQRLLLGQKRRARRKKDRTPAPAPFDRTALVNPSGPPASAESRASARAQVAHRRATSGAHRAS